MRGCHGEQAGERNSAHVPTNAPIAFLVRTRVVSVREITLQHAATCRRCGAPLAVGVRASWSPETKATTCVRCDVVRSAPKRQAAAPAGRGEAVRGAASGRAGSSPWAQLVDYHRRAVLRASVTAPVAVSRRSTWRILDLPSEELVTGMVDELAVTPPVMGMFTDLAPGDAVYYGWPVVIGTDRAGAQWIAPLVMTELERPDVAARSVVARDEQPYLNPGLLSEPNFANDVLAGVEDQVTTPLPFGDPGAMAARSGALLAALGFDATGVDPRTLARSGTLRPGVLNVAMVFQGPSDFATRALSEELLALRDRTDWQQTAAAVLVDQRPHSASPVVGEPARVGTEASFVAGLPPLSVRSLRLNDSQEQALTAAATERVTVVTGPPGTGKSQLVAGIVANQWLAGGTVLVASTNNTAVDVAVERCDTIDRALLVRTGNREHRDALPDAVAPLAGRTRVDGLSRDIIRRRLEAAASARSRVLDALTLRSAQEGELAQGLRDLEGMRSLLWGSPVAEPTRSERRRLHTLCDKRAASRLFTARRGRAILSLAHPVSSDVTLDDVLHWAALDAHTDELTAHLTSLGPSDPDIDRAAIDEADLAWSEAGNQALAETVQVFLASAGPALRQLGQVRQQAGAAVTGAIKRSLPHLRGWGCTALAVKSNFPLTAGLFDLLVIDEASQCGIAQILPLAYRAKRVVIVGDPNQLTPVVKLNRGHVDTIAAACGTTEAQLGQAHLSAVTDSAFTAYAERTTRSYLLDEHYRCHPQIAGFINDHFYGGTLRVLTDVSRYDQHPRGLSFIDVDGTTERGAIRGASNSAEADAIVAWVLAHPHRTGTLGIISPFAAQVALIRSKLASALGSSALTADTITIGTAHAFQGGECDVVLFSPVLATGAPLGTAMWVEKQRNLINVAVSRAKRAFIVFGDHAALAELPVPTLHALVTAARTDDAAPARTSAPTDTELAEIVDLHSDAERRLYAALLRLDLAVHLKPVIEGYELDFAVQTPTGLVDIEVDGSQHTDQRGRQRRQDLARDAVLQATGLRVIRVPAWRCLQDADTTAREIAARL
jgi:very-short-patch-repair endonuclease